MNWKILIIFLFTVLRLFGDIGGVVYQDVPAKGNQKNNYGLKETNELGIAGVRVSIMSDSGVSAITTTKSDGSWYLVTTDKGFRVEFSNWFNYLLESPKGVGGENSAIRFVKNGDINITFGLYDMNCYFSTVNPSYVTTIILNGSNKNSSLPTLVSNNYRDSKVNKNILDGLGNQGTGNPFKVNAVASQTGTVWGLGYQALKKRMFVASSLWRHSGNVDKKIDRIFVIDYNGSNKISGVINLQGVNGIDLGDVNRTGDRNYELPDDPSAPNVDLDAFVKAGKVSFGDLDFDERTQTVWVVNLFQKAIIRMDASFDDLNRTASSAQQYLLSNLAGTPTCIGGVLRPWALAIHQGKGYIGMVCDASISQNKKDLKAHLASFDLLHPENGLRSELSINLDYDRKTNADGFQGNQYYFPWTDKRQKTISFTKDFFWDYYNQPLLSDIEFDAKGNAYLAFTDRYTLQIGFRQYPAAKNPKLIEEAVEGYGEIFKVCSVNGKFLLEGSSPDCPEGKSRNGDVDFFDDKGGDLNANSIGGSLAILPGTEQVLSTVNSPHPDGGYGREYHVLSGVETFNTKDGSIDNWYAHVLGEKPYHGKGVGLGDLELLNESPPIEIGDRVWLDRNGNGIQDVNEVGIEGIKLELYHAGVLLASAITNKDGEYLFSSDSSQINTSNRKYNIQALEASKSYLLRVPNIKGDNKQSLLRSFLVATSGNGVGNTATLHDSNVTVNGDNIEIVIVPNLGNNDHSVDIGFKPLTPIVGGVDDFASYSCTDYKTNSIGSIDSKIAILLLMIFNLLLVFIHQEDIFNQKRKKF